MWSHHSMASVMGRMKEIDRFYFLAPKLLAVDGDGSYKIKDAALWKKSCNQPREGIKGETLFLVSKHPYRQSYGFFSSCVQM